MVNKDEVSGEFAASVQHHGKRSMWLALSFFLKLDKLLKNKQKQDKATAMKEN